MGSIRMINTNVSGSDRSVEANEVQSRSMIGAT
jgi:hypothetical protein